MSSSNMPIRISSSTTSTRRRVVGDNPSCDDILIVPGRERPVLDADDLRRTQPATEPASPTGTDPDQPGLEASGSKKIFRGREPTARPAVYPSSQVDLQPPTGLRTSWTWRDPGEPAPWQPGSFFVLIQ